MDKERYELAVKQLNDWAYEYYTNDVQAVPDSVYDDLYREVRNFEQKNPDLVIATSPTQRVGDVVLDGFDKRKHREKLYSLEDVFDLSEFEEWVKKAHRAGLMNTTYYLEPKYDGISLNIGYEDGNLIYAITRGDGEEGEDVTANIPYVKGVPLHIPYKGFVEIRGEIVLFKKDFEKVNKAREKSGKPPFKNERNAVGGALKTHESKYVKEYMLRFSPFGLGFNELGMKTQKEEYDWIISQGFTNWGSKPEYLSKIADSAQKVLEAYNQMIAERDNFPMLLDGLVVKINNKEEQERLGFTSKLPKWACAFKFPAEEVKTKVLDIIAQVGKTGQITPVAIVEPVEVGGVTVSRATLHNYDEIKEKDIRIGDEVFIIRSGDVIPKIVEVKKISRNGSEVIVTEPKYCPECGSDHISRKIITSQKKGEKEFSAAIYCKNPKCKKQLAGIIQYAVGRKALNIDGIGKAVIEDLVEKEMVTALSDIFSLKKEDFLGLEKFKEKKANNAVKSIESAKGVEIYRLINALNIDELGESASKKLAKNNTALSAFMNRITDQEVYLSVEDFGPVLVANIVEFLADNVRFDEFKKLVEILDPVIPEKVDESELVLDGKKFVITGTLSKSRGEFSKIIESLGGSVGSSVSKKTDYLLCGENGGSKQQKANDLGVKILNEEEFLKLFNISL